MTNLQSLMSWAPELILSTTALLLILYAALPEAWKAPRACVIEGPDGAGQESCDLDWASYIALAGVVAAIGLAVGMDGLGPYAIFGDTLAFDHGATFFKVFVYVATILAIVFSQRTRELSQPVDTERDEFAERPRPFLVDDAPEYYALILGMAVGMSLLVAATNLLVIYLALELTSLMSYLLVGYAPGRERSSEAALKYVLYGAVASGLFLYGASLYYGFVGSLSIDALATASGGGVAIFLAGVLMLAGFLYKVAAVPMQAWCPDAYEGAPTPITALLSVAPKTAGFAVLMRVAASIGQGAQWPVLIAAVSAATMTLGNLAAIPQANVKRMLAYSSIAHAGYLLMGVACMTPRGTEAVLFYLVAYLLMNLGAFLVVQIVANESGSEMIDAYVGLCRRGWQGLLTGVAMMIFLLSLVGIPPLVGFVGKFYLFTAVLDAKLYWLAVFGIVNSVISLYYYMRIAKAIFFDATPHEASFRISSVRLGAALVALALAVLGLGLAWGPLVNLVAMARG